MSELIGISGAIGSGKSTFSTMLSEFEPKNSVYEIGQIVAELAEDFNKVLSNELTLNTAKDDIELVNQALIWFIEAIEERMRHKITWNQLAITKQHMADQPELYDKWLLYLNLARKQPVLLSDRITQGNKAVYRPLLQWLGNYMVEKVSKTIWIDEIFHRISQHDDDKNLIIINGLRYPSDAEALNQRGGKIIEIIRPDIKQADSDDPTEVERNEIKANIQVINDGSLGDLRALAEKLWEDLAVSEPKITYSAK